MPQEIMLDIKSIREWLAKESYLPQDFKYRMIVLHNPLDLYPLVLVKTVIDIEQYECPNGYCRGDMMLKKFLHSCYGSLEKTKKCIERFCTTRATMIEAYTNRHPNSSNLKVAFSKSTVTSYEAGDLELLIYHLCDDKLDNFVYYDMAKTFCIQADHWLNTFQFFPEGHVIVFDMRNITLKHIPKCNIMFFRDFLIYLLEGMPVRVKQVHVVNCPSYYEKLYALVKPVLPVDIRNMIKFHSSSEELHKFFDKKYLPSDYGGERESMIEQQEKWVREILEDGDFYGRENLWKADLKKKPKSSGVVENSMNGSFRSLSID